MFRLFFLAYLQVGHILSPASLARVASRRLSSRLDSRRILRANRNAKNDVMSRGKSLMIPDVRVRSRYY